MNSVFIHGLESSSNGTKGRWFMEQFPEMLMTDFIGSLDERMVQLGSFLSGRTDLQLVGSSFGGLMATVYAINHSIDVSRVILLAPALNFHEFEKHRSSTTDVPAIIYTGNDDTVCPPDLIIPVAEKVFTNLTVHRVEDDHLFHCAFNDIDWVTLIK